MYDYECKIGDVIIANGLMSGISFNGQRGVIITNHSLWDEYSILWGIDFIGASFSYDERQLLHNLRDLLPTRTGYYLTSNLFTLYKKRGKTGFSQFITRIENS